jgi:hypothetical protein
LPQQTLAGQLLLVTQQQLLLLLVLVLLLLLLLLLLYLLLVLLQGALSHLHSQRRHSQQQCGGVEAVPPACLYLCLCLQLEPAAGLCLCLEPAG